MAVQLTTSFKSLGTAQTSTYSEIRLYGKYNSPQDKTNNRTSVTLELRIYGDGGSGSFDSGTAKINNDQKSLGSTSYTSGSEKTIHTLTYYVYHLGDGTATNVAVSGFLHTSSPKMTDKTISAAISLPQIPRQNSLAVTSGVINDSSNPVTITIGKNSDSFTNTVKYSTDNGSTYTTIQDINNVYLDHVPSGTYYWKPPSSLFSLIPNDSSLNIKYLNKTYNGNTQTQIGDDVSKSGTITVGDISKPTIDLKVSSPPSRTETNQDVINGLGLSSPYTFNAPVIPLSKPRFILTANSLDESTLDRCIINDTITLDLKQNSSEVTLSNNGKTAEIDYTFSSSQSWIYSFVVYDSREKSSTPNYVYNGHDNTQYYTAPNIQSYKIWRSNAVTGETKLTIGGTYNSTKLDGTTNTLSVKYKSKSTSDNTQWENISTINDLSSSITVNNGTWSLTAHTLPTQFVYNDNFYIQIILEDGVLSSPITQVITLLKEVPTFSIGEDDLQVNGDLYLADNNGQNVIDVRQALGGGSLIDKIYPVGSIYMSVNDINPDIVFGGTWVRLGVGRTLVSAGGGTNSTPVSDTNDFTGRGTYTGTTTWFPVGQMGGETDHQLSVAELAKHTHIQDAHGHRFRYNSTGSVGGSRDIPISSGSSWKAKGTWVENTTATNQNTGNDTAHNNIQPYLAVYMWKRTA